MSRLQASDNDRAPSERPSGPRPPLRLIPTEFRVRIVRRTRLSVVQIVGEIDTATVPVLIVALDREHASDALVLDMAEVTFVSSTGVGLITTLHRRLTRRGGHLVL